jgi:hypothetical protein
MGDYKTLLHVVINKGSKEEHIRCKKIKACEKTNSKSTSMCMF